MKSQLFAASILLLSFFGANVSAQNAQAPQKIEWQHEMSAEMRNNLASKPALVADLQDAYKGWLANRCYSARSREECLKEPNPPFAQMFDAIPYAQADLNNDRKLDLILFLSNDTGMSGAGNCGIMEYRIYENIGYDYRKVAKTEMVANYGLFLGRPKARGNFRDIYWKSVTRACSAIGEQDIIDRYNRRNRSY